MIAPCHPPRGAPLAPLLLAACSSAKQPALPVEGPDAQPPFDGALIRDGASPPRDADPASVVGGCHFESSALASAYDSLKRPPCP
jgi:hypothetical protein